MKPTATIQTATKQLVDSLLAINTNNRKIKDYTVSKYQDDIKNGKWLLTNQGIGVSCDNVLLDGQHRLEALKRSGYPPLQILIVRDLDPQVMFVVDQQSKRTARDMIHFAFNYRVSQSAPAIANAIIAFIDMDKIATMTKTYDKICEYKEEIEFVTSVPKNASYYAAAYLAGFCHSIKIGSAKEKVKELMEMAESGEMLNNKMPSFHLKNAVDTGAKGGGYMVRKDRFWKAIKACSYHCEGKSMGVLRA